MESNSSGHQETGSAEQGSRDELIDRFDVALRIAYSLLFAAIISVLHSITALVVAFQLIYSLITQSMPSQRVQRLANSLVSYVYQILRYLTHNDSLIPFPFSDFPEPLEPTRDAYAPHVQVDRKSVPEPPED